MTLPSCPYLLNSSPSRGVSPGNRSLIASRPRTGETLSNLTIMPNEIVLPAMRFALTSYPSYSKRRACSLYADLSISIPCSNFRIENGDRRIVEIGKRLIFLKIPRFDCRITRQADSGDPKTPGELQQKLGPKGQVMKMWKISLSLLVVAGERY